MPFEEPGSIKNIPARSLRRAGGAAIASRHATGFGARDRRLVKTVCAEKHRRTGSFQVGKAGAGIRRKSSPGDWARVGAVWALAQGISQLGPSVVAPE